MEDDIVFELCNQAVTKIIGFKPSLNKLNPGSILSNSGAKLLNTPLFTECKVADGEESKVKFEVQLSASKKAVSFKDSIDRPSNDFCAYNDAPDHANDDN